MKILELARKNKFKILGFSTAFSFSVSSILMGFSVLLYTGKIDSLEVNLNYGLIWSICALFIFIGILSVFKMMALEVRYIWETQDWLINATKWNIERLKANGLCKTPEDETLESVDSKADRWPWGSHHTEALGHLDAAAQRFWTLYDPAEDSTAPTNRQVAEWLQKERGLSQKMAEAMASILRADGLPTGPRK